MVWFISSLICGVSLYSRYCLCFVSSWLLPACVYSSWFRHSSYGSVHCLLYVMHPSHITICPAAIAMNIHIHIRHYALVTVILFPQVIPNIPWLTYIWPQKLYVLPGNRTQICVSNKYRFSAWNRFHIQFICCYTFHIVDYSFIGQIQNDIYKMFAIIWIVQRHSTNWQLSTKTIENMHNFPSNCWLLFPCFVFPRIIILAVDASKMHGYFQVIIAKLHEINGQSKYAICVFACMCSVHCAHCTRHGTLMMSDERV